MPTAAIQQSPFTPSVLKLETWQSVCVNGVGTPAVLRISLIDSNYQTVSLVSATTGIPADDIQLTQPADGPYSLAALIVLAGYIVPTASAASFTSNQQTIGARIANLTGVAVAYNFAGSADGSGTGVGSTNNGVRAGRSGPSDSSPWQLPAGGTLDIGGFYDN